MKVKIDLKKASVAIQPKKENIKLEATYSKVIEGEVYHGEYEITPLPFQMQELETKDKILEKNVKVKEIPYFETSNIYGDTVYIGSEV